MLISIVTPSFRQLDWLRLAVASVRDQGANGLTIEHIVQDAGSPGIEDFAREVGADFYREGCLVFEASPAVPHPPHYRIVIHSEPDEGMYDAVNKGFLRATGDVFAYLNCDEQYLPGALVAVSKFFLNHPKVETVFGDTIVIYSDGSYMCHRKGLAPQKAHTLVSGNLSFATASVFSKACVFRNRNLYFDKKWKDVGDAVWGHALCSANVRMESLGFATTAFTDTGDNMNIRPNALREKESLRKSAPSWMQILRQLVIIHYRFRKAFAGAYSTQPGRYQVMTRKNPTVRQEFQFNRPSHRWVGR